MMMLLFCDVVVFVLFCVEGVVGVEVGVGVGVEVGVGVDWVMVSVGVVMMVFVSNSVCNVMVDVV